jgi:hypothetical protein
MLKRLALMAWLAFVTFPAIAARPATERHIILIGEERDVHREMKRLVGRLGLKPVYPCVALNGFLADVPRKSITRLRADPAVAGLRGNTGRMGQRCAGE